MKLEEKKTGELTVAQERRATEEKNKRTSFLTTVRTENFIAQMKPDTFKIYTFANSFLFFSKHEENIQKA